MRGEELGHALGVLGVPVHAYRERLDSPQDEETIHRPRHGADGVLEEGQPGGDLGIAHDDRSTDDVRVSAEVLGRRVDDQVGSKLERPL